MKKTYETWSEYLANSNATKNEKTFNITLRRKKSGEFKVVGRGALMENNMGGKSEWVNVDARDLTSAIRNNGIFAK
jgi:hypothetical protein